MKVIALNESKNITYFGDCKLQSNGIEKCLKLRIIDKDPEETMTSSYNRIYICKNARHPELSNAAKIEEQMFKADFYIPLIKQVQLHVTGYQDIKNILLDFTNSLDSDERLLYLNVLAETLLVPSISTTSASKTSAFNSSGDSKKNYSMRKRSFTNITSKESEKENDEILPKKSALSSIIEPFPKNSSADVMYDIVEYFQDGEMHKKILVFTSAERKKCYEYFYRNNKSHWRCIKCSALKKSTVINGTIHGDGSKTFDFNRAEEHICEPIDFLIENYHSSLIVKSPNFEFLQRDLYGKMKTLLVIYDSNDKNISCKFVFDSYHKHYYCFECKKQGLTDSARFIQHNGVNAIELANSQRRCKLKDCAPQTLSHNTSKSKTTFSNDQIETSATSFNESDVSMNPITSNNINRNESVNENDEILLENSNLFLNVQPSPQNPSDDVISHKESDKENDKIFCERSNISLSIETLPQNSSSDVFFDIVEYSVNGKCFKKLLLFTSAERKKCYEYLICRNSINFRCFKCFALKKTTEFKAIINEDGCKTLNFNPAEEHVCQPIEYLPQNYQTSLIIKPPNFEFVQREINGIMKPLLIIYNSDDRSVCYKFEYSSEKCYFCPGCKQNGMNLSARVIQQNGTDAIELEHSQHICEPINYIPECL
uniref:Uncharacterized protein n=1 Tax=Panagrolaimus sp. ES5 TaxID=591445 RepID=A0AC34F6Q4_9BILA